MNMFNKFPLASKAEQDFCFIKIEKKLKKHLPHLMFVKIIKHC